MASVDSALTPITVKVVARSFCGCEGIAAASARAAEAPQIATAPPVSRPKKTLKPKRRASRIPQPMVRATASTVAATVSQPSAVTCAAVMRNPSSATPSRSTWRAVKAMPGRAARLVGQEVERHADQQREQHHRLAVVLREEGRCDGDHGAHRHAGQQGLGLTKVLKDCPVWTKELEKQAKEAGISWRTVRRASDTMHVIKRKAYEGRWYWSLPRLNVSNSSNLANMSNVSSLDNLANMGNLEGEQA